LKQFVLPAILAIVFSANAAPQQQGQLDGNPTLFTVMAAINAAGYSADLSSPFNSPLRNQVRAEIQGKGLACLPELKKFFEDHHKHGMGSDTAELSQYVSFALSAGPPPAFAFTQRDVDVPPDVVPIRSLSPLLARFYREADIEGLWRRAQPAIDAEIARLHDAASEAVQEVTSYLRYVPSGIDHTHFQIYVEPLAAPNQIQARSYGYQFTVVATPSPYPRAFDLRHEFLHYLLDPLATLQQETLDRKKVLAEEAQRAPALDDSFKEDFLLLTTESLIKAIEARLDRKPEGVQQALRQGYILTPFFAEELPIYEKQEQPMKSFYPEMAGAIDLIREVKRLDNVEFDKRAPLSAAVNLPVPPPAPPLTGAAKTLDEAESLYEARAGDAANLERAKKLYLDVLNQTGDQPVHAAAYYGLARIAALQKDPDAAEQLFQKTLQSQPEPQIKAWALVYLGRLSLAAGESQEAARSFQEALKVEGAPETARKAASEGLQDHPKQ